jgi:hypothetical protein
MMWFLDYLMYLLILFGDWVKDFRIILENGGDIIQLDMI